MIGCRGVRDEFGKDASGFSNSKVVLLFFLYQHVDQDIGFKLIIWKAAIDQFGLNGVNRWEFSPGNSSVASALSELAHCIGLPS